MLKIWELKKKADEEKAARKQQQQNGNSSQLMGQQSHLSPARIRVQSDLSSIELPSSMRLEFQNTNDLMHFILHFKPETGYYRGGSFSFTFDISENYPIDPPRVQLVQKIYHPNIDLQGALCLNILREDWKPVLSLNHIAIGIQFLFLEPNQNDPLNKKAAQSLKCDPEHFAFEVHEAMEGRKVGDEQFDYVLY